MRARKRESRLFEMIEDPQCPPIRRMASVALFAQPTLVHVVLGVTVNTPRFHFAEGLGAMALSAADHIMSTQEREAGQVVIKTDLAVPILLAVAGVTARLEF